MTYRRPMRRACALLLLLAACGPDDSSGPCKDDLVAGDLVITEVFADYAAPDGGTGTDDGKEWFEVYNNSERAISLKGLTVVHSRPDGANPSSHTMADVTVAPGQFFTLGNSTSDLVPAYVDYGYSADLGGLYNSDGGKLALKCGDSEIDSASYELVKSGRSRQLSNLGPPDYTANDDLANWCEAKDTEFEPNNFGTPGEDNDCAPVIAGACTDNGAMRPVVSPAVGELVITEVMPNPAAVGDADGEWVEVHALADVDLNGLVLDRAGDSAAGATIDSPACLRLGAGSYALVAKNTDMGLNGGLPAEQVMGSFSFSLVDGTVADPGDVQIVSGTTVLDAISWTSTRSGRSHQLDPDRYDPTQNDDESNFCDGTDVYNDNMGMPTKDYGTPGSANVACPLVAPPGMCIDNGTVRAIQKPMSGALVITEVMVNPKIESPAGQEWFEITNTSNQPFDLNELALDRASDSAAANVILAGACKSLAPGAFALFARSAESSQNAMLPAVDATFSFSMPNTSGDVQVLDGTTVLDKFTYGSVNTTMYDGYSLSLQPADFTATPDDLVDAPPLAPMTPWCLGQTPYGDNTNQGTPRAANPACP